MLFREGETQAPEGNQLASPVDTAAPGDSLTASRSPRSPEAGMGRGPLGPHCLCFQEQCPRRKKGIQENIRPVELQPEKEGGFSYSPALDPQVVGSHPSLACY